MQHDNLKIVSLISVGCHPKSGRARRAEQDGRAVELGLKLAGKSLTMLHTGNQDEQALRTYLGMGLESMTVISQTPSADVIPAMVDYLSQENPDIILTGVRAESGEGSGMTPYIIAEKLGIPLITNITDIGVISDGEAEVFQSLPRGQRRLLSVSLPFVGSVDLASKAPRQSAFGPGQRARVDVQIKDSVVDDIRIAWQEAPAKKRPKRIKIAKGNTAADRLKAATVKSSSGGKVIKKGSNVEKALAIFDMLKEEGVLKK